MARQFVSCIIQKALAAHDLQGSDIVITAPVQAYETYTRRLEIMAQNLGFENVEIISEPVAAALTMIGKANDKDVYLIFDFGSYTLDVALVRFEKSNRAKQCKVLGEKSIEVAGDDIDRWLLRYVEDHPRARGFAYIFQKLHWKLIQQCRLAKQELSFHNESEIVLQDVLTQKPFRLTISRAEFEEVLKQKRLVEVITETISETFKDAKRRCGDSVPAESQLAAVLLVGGSSYLPLVQNYLKSRFGKGKIIIRRPIEAVVRGAAAFASGEVQLFNYLKHYYAIQSNDVESKTQSYSVILSSGSEYPCDARTTTWCPTWDGQTQFSMHVYEFQEDPSNLKHPYGENPSGGKLLNKYNPTDLDCPEPTEKREQLGRTTFI